MNPSDLLKNLKLDSWYMVCMLLGIMGLVVAFTFEVKVLTNSQLASLSGFFFLLGLGIWKGERQEVKFYPGLVVNQPTYRPDPIGCSFLIVSAVLLGVFATSIFNSANSTAQIIPSAIIETSTPTPTPTAIVTLSVTLTP